MANIHRNSLKANIIGKIYSENTDDKSEGFAAPFSLMLIPSADEKPLKDMFYNFPSHSEPKISKNF